ncbi:MAG TPA: hypothetical protein PKA27_15130 [Fimbriimonadaceae bacterium]|nr:hypothetical protein [Fimbriimonadaceae bacterium]
MGVAIRPIVESDADFMRSMALAIGRIWLEAGHEFEPKDLMVYLDGWGREGDLGVVAMAGDREVGAAWLRLFDYEACGPGFVSPGVPELAMAAEPYARGEVEDRLVDGLFLLARSQKVAFVSTAVPSDCEEKALLESLGFADAGFSDEQDALQILLACL